MKFRQSIFLLTVVAVIVALVACSTSSKKTTVTPPISVAFSTTSAPPTSLLTNAQVKFAAVVDNDSFNDGVTWSVTCGSTVAGACGTFSFPAATASNIPTTYTAPAQAPSGGTVTIIATAVSDLTKSAQTTITITAPLSVAFSSGTPSSLQVNTQLSLTAVVSNDSANGGVTWSVTCGSAGACGTLSSTTTPSGAATTYTAPSAVPAGNTVTVTATSVTDPTKSAQAVITITTISVAFNPAPPTSLPPSAQQSFTAVVSNDSANGGVTWSVTCGSPGACGTFSATTTPSGTSTTYSAPSAAPAGNTVTVTATSVTDPTKSAQAIITIGVPPLADGSYVFSLSGLDKTFQPYFVDGVLVVSGGGITSGEQDFNDIRAGHIDQIKSSGSSISTTADGNLQIIIATTDTGVGVNGVETLDGAKVSASRYLITEFDTSATSSGTLDLQTSTAAPSGGYAFFIGGINMFAAPLAIGGVINVDGSGTISGAGSVFDMNNASWDSGVVLQNQAFAASTVSAPDSFGRIEFNLVPSAASGVSTINLVGYMVDASHIKLVETSDSLNGHTGGMALGQGASTGTFSSASIAGSSFVFATSGKDTNNNFNNGVFQVAGVLTADSGGTVSGTLNFNDLQEGPQSPIPFTGTYTVDPTGRVTLSNLTNSPLLTAEFYLTGDGHGTVVSMDTTDVLAGLAFQQTGGGSFTAGSFSGTYVMDASGADSNNEAELDEVGPITADGVGTLAGTVDLNWFSSPPVQHPDLSVSGTFTADPSGVFTGTITGLDVQASSNQLAFTYYLIDTTKVVAIETDSNQLTLGYFELQH